MAKLIHILAASLGGGLVLGAGIRLGEHLAGHNLDSPGSAGPLADRLSSLEGRLTSLESSPPGASTAAIDLRGIESRIAAQAAEVSAVRVRLDAGAKEVATLGQTDERLRSELRTWLDQRVDERLRGVETKLREESDEAQREMLSAVIESVQTRVIQRITRLEEEVAGQAEGMTELRECTLRTEQSMQKLLGGIEKLLAAQTPRVPEPAKTYNEPEPAAEPELPAPPVAIDDTTHRFGGLTALSGGADAPRRRWGIFS